MNKLLVAVATVLMSSGVASTADAALITRYYTTVSTFASGHYLSVTQKYTVTFDPTIEGSITLSNYSSNVGNPFDQQPYASRILQTSRFGDVNAISLFYAANGYSYGGGSAGFGLAVNFNQQGSVTSSELGYSTGTDYFSAATSVTTVELPPIVINPTAAVPEPATWAMMMLGFGGMGYAMRRRKVGSARIRFA